jgi:hypothetical protein
LEGGPPSFPRDSTCPAVLKHSPWVARPFAYGALTRSGRGSHHVRLRQRLAVGGPSPALDWLPTPRPQRRRPLTRPRFGLFPVRSPLLRESRLISTPRGTKMFQFPRFPPRSYGFRAGYRGMTPCTLPHSGIPGSTPADGSPRLFAANHALHRLLAPRHPPCALRSAAPAPSRARPTPDLTRYSLPVLLSSALVPVPGPQRESRSFRPDRTPGPHDPADRTAPPSDQAPHPRGALGPPRVRSGAWLLGLRKGTDWSPAEGPTARDTKTGRASPPAGCRFGSRC